MSMRTWVVLGLIAALGLSLGCGSGKQAEAPKDTKQYEGKPTAPEAPKLPPPPK